MKELVAKKLNQQEAEQKVKDYNEEYELISIYIKSDKPITLRHNCGHEYIISKYKSFFEGKNKCPKCYPIIPHGKSTRRVTEKDIIERMKNKLGTEYSYIEGYVKISDKMKVRHNICGNIFEVSPDMLLGNKNSRCPICANKNRGKYSIKENYLESLLLNTIDGKDYEWLEEYKNNNKIKLNILHKSCNRSYKVKPNDFQQGYRCPYCNSEKTESYYITHIKKFFNDNNIAYKTEVTFNDLIYKGKLRFDFELKNLIIEFDGKQHFKESFSIEEYKNTKIRDSIKNKWILNQTKYSFLRIPSNISYKDLNDILNHIKNNNINNKLINKYNLYYYNSDTNIVFNSNKYYININKNYFID